MEEKKYEISDSIKATLKDMKDIVDSLKKDTEPYYLRPEVVKNRILIQRKYREGTKNENNKSRSI